MIEPLELLLRHAAMRWLGELGCVPGLQMCSGCCSLYMGRLHSFNEIWIWQIFNFNEFWCFDSHIGVWLGVLRALVICLV